MLEITNLSDTERVFIPASGDEQRALKHTNCPNCGAPLDRSGKCDHCGTVRQPKSSIVITPNEIRLTCE